VKSDVLDAIDRELLRLLGENGRASFTELGSTVGLSPHATADRVRRLQETGVIRGFTTLVDHAALGGGLEALIDVRLLAATAPERFEEFVATLPDARDLWFVTGRYDYELRLTCADPEALDRTVREIRRSGGVAATETRIVMRSRRFPDS